MAIWERYLLRQLLEMFFLFLFCFYGLYVLIDYASHTRILDAHQKDIHWQEIIRYYLFVFASRAEILFPLALLIACIRTLCTLNRQQEIVAFLAGGFSLKTLLRPLMLVGAFGTLLMYANEQYLLPEALRKLRQIEQASKHQRGRSRSMLHAQHLVLGDASLLVFQYYDPLKEQFFDVYWIQSMDSIYRMKYLSPTATPPMGYFVDHLVRDQSGELLQKTDHRECHFPQMVFSPNLLESTIIDPETLSISELMTQVLDVSPSPNEKESKILTSFYWKLNLPWLCLLSIMAPAPFCVRFSRQPPVFLIYMCSLFGFIAFYMFMNAAQIAAKRQVFHPFWGVYLPFLTLFSYFGWRFNRLTIF